MRSNQRPDMSLARTASPNVPITLRTGRIASANGPSSRSGDCTGIVCARTVYFNSNKEGGGSERERSRGREDLRPTGNVGKSGGQQQWHGKGHAAKPLYVKGLLM